ncbi:aspartate aminotransferase family protein [Paludibacter jiangxiensis]|uniref:Acetylornithine aminotransferase n=1 Tax=Paludibacter jiangxiensis TaxID=681398 RepID=A0A170ZGR8_9BACT|nr:aminotransferase class III-fold pyridoxal phosphate-dependent enzyme [Paludibacter jiangxiensis]GAT62652.1 acetylornithine aminotransferase [Paludibacter jiangxiensis]
MKPFDVYPLFDIEIVKGEGCYTYDAQGNKYLDLYGGHAVISIGHTHPHYVKRVTDQLNKLGFYSNSVQNSLQVHLAEKLGKASGYEDYDLFMINTGAEANENALKLASFYNGKKRIVSFGKSFHGRTSAAVRVTDNPKIVAPVNSGMEVTFLPLDDIDAVKAELAKGDVSSVIIEGIQGVGGIRIPDDNFLKQLRQVCDGTDTVLILDEIQSGYGRSGKFFAHQYAGIRPDMITVAKGIGNGFPIGAVLIAPKFKAVHGQLGTTFGGNHLACAAALAVLEVMGVEKLVENAAEVGDFLMVELKKISGIKEVRGRGLMIGIEFEESAAAIRRKLLFEEKVFTGASGTNVIRLLPPLCLTKNEAEIFLERFKKVLK